jgi:hypothetical protein
MVHYLFDRAVQNRYAVGRQSMTSRAKLSDGKILCVMEAPNTQALAAWFEKTKVPCDGITAVELEGERGVVKDA